jgi:oxazoline/thiazoline synthase
MQDQITLRWSNEWQVIGETAQGVLLSCEDRTYFLEGTNARAVVTQLQGGGSVASEPAMLEELRRIGAVVEAPPPIPSVEITALHPAGVDILAVLLPSVKAAEVRLVLTDDYLRPEVRTIAQSETRPWILARLSGRTILIGPRFSAGQTACWFCLAHWLRINRPLQAALFGTEEGGVAPQPASLNDAAVAAAGAALLAHRIRSGAVDALDSTVMQIEPDTLRVTRAPVIRRPACPHCRPATALEVPWHAWAAPVTGIVFGMRTTSDPIFGLYHAQAWHRQPLPVPPLRRVLKADACFGAGATIEDAQRTCVFEALERYSEAWRGDERVVRAKLSDIGGIAPSDILLYSQSQYNTRSEWNRKHPDLFEVPEPFDTSAATCWVRATSLSPRRTDTYVPAAVCYLWFPFHDEPEFCIADTSGCAAGPTMEEARARALLEAVERDAVAIWWYNRLQRPGLTAASLRELRVPEGFTVVDITTDLGIPCYAAIHSASDGSRPAFGAAAHLDAASAVRRAVAEAAQMAVWGTEGAAPELAEWLTTANVGAETWLRACGHADIRSSFDGSAGELLRESVRRLEECGLDAYACDLTRDDVGVPVARVIVPGLRHPWARFAPGRLYDVPVKLGWLATPTREEDLNPLLCPL